jgi:hypothetical protein
MSDTTRKFGKFGNRYHKYTPTPETSKQVMAMTGYGIKQEDIAAVLDMNPATLRRYYRRELDTGATEANARVVQALFRNATVNESVQAQVWWTKARMGWKDGSEVNVTGNLPLMIFTGVERAHDVKTIEAERDDTD